ncbi:hypothetical protein IAT38_000521 [Cryptococcus sp. DSM 104549]
MSEVCKDCEQPIPQPATGSAMAHAPSSPTGLAGPHSADSPAPSAPAKTEAATPASSATEAQADFVAPDLRDVKPSVIIEFCDRCRWAPRASWIQTELFLTFQNPLLRSITLMPLNAPETGGRFRVWVDVGKGAGEQLVWDRQTEGGFPELKILKQRIRNLVQPDMGLGHSDVHGKNGEAK